jgi:hypothetical protein
LFSEFTLDPDYINSIAKIRNLFLTGFTGWTGLLKLCFQFPDEIENVLIRSTERYASFPTQHFPRPATMRTCHFTDIFLPQAMEPFWLASGQPKQLLNPVNPVNPDNYFFRFCTFAPLIRLFQVPGRKLVVPDDKNGSIPVLPFLKAESISTAHPSDGSDGHQKGKKQDRENHR